jgi:hypothetical protein
LTTSSSSSRWAWEEEEEVVELSLGLSGCAGLAQVYQMILKNEDTGASQSLATDLGFKKYGNLANQ